MIPESVLSLIRDEQLIQDGRFIPQDESYLEKLSQHAELLLHQDRGNLLGYVFFYCNEQNKNISYISLIGTSVAARGRGVGYGLLQHVLLISKLRGFSRCQLEVHKKNTHAFEFYQRAGFTIEEDRGEKYLMQITTQ